MSNSEIRLQKFISDSGVTSRRKAEELILQGRVTVNGEIITILGTKVNPAKDSVVVDGRPVELSMSKKVYIILNKPRSCVSTVSDPEDRPTVMDYCKEVGERIYPVGRLDYLSEGLLIMTNDGDLANKIIHPSFDIIKTYEVKVFGIVTETMLQKLKKGCQIDGELYKPRSIRILKLLDNKTWLEFRIGEGKNREIRRFCEACDLTVDKLKRVAIGNLSIEGIAPGKFHYVTKQYLIDSIGIDTVASDQSEERNLNSAKSNNSNNKSAPQFFSNKKTVGKNKLRKISAREDIVSADNEIFKLYRKENYYKTVDAIKRKKLIEGEKAEESEKGETRSSFKRNAFKKSDARSTNIAKRNSDNKKQNFKSNSRKANFEKSSTLKSKSGNVKRVSSNRRDHVRSNNKGRMQRS